MAKPEKTQGKTEKYFFDMHNFDDRHGEEPPPPAFSQQELDAAKKESYERGKKDGLAEAAASRERQIVTLLDKVTQNFSTLFLAEDSRMRVYETESVILARALFEKMFPGMNEYFGLKEIEQAVLQVLQLHKAQPHIRIEVKPDYVESIQELADKALLTLHSAGKCTVVADEALGAGDCRLSWLDGGAYRDIPALVQEIASIFQQTLAEKANLRDNKTVETTS